MRGHEDRDGIMWLRLEDVSQRLFCGGLALIAITLDARRAYQSIRQYRRLNAFSVVEAISAGFDRL